MWNPSLHGEMGYNTCCEAGHEVFWFFFLMYVLSDFGFFEKWG